jgi:tRNA A37 methylthiotransferase MiaB
MMKTYVGRVVSVLLERKWKGSDGWMQGLTTNYLKVRVPGEDGMKNRILAVRLDGIDNGFLVGRLLEK